MYRICKELLQISEKKGHSIGRGTKDTGTSQTSIPNGQKAYATKPKLINHQETQTKIIVKTITYLLEHLYVKKLVIPNG